MAILPTPVPTPNLPGNYSYVGSYGKGYVAPKGSVLGSSNASGALNYSPANFIGPTKPSTYKAPVTKKVSYAPQSQQAGGDMPGTIDENLFTAGIEEPNRDLEIINQEFDNFQNFLNQQESAAKGNFADTQNLMTTQKASQEALLGQEKDIQTKDIKNTEQLNLNKVRQLLSDLNQRDASRMALTGQSSVGEAVAERFGRRAQEGLSGVMQSAQQGLERVGLFYNQAMQKLQDNYNATILNAKQQLDQNLSEIGYQRNQSATSKQQATLSAWRDYYNNLNQAKLQAAQFKAQYDIWKQQQDNAYSAWGAQSQGVAEDVVSGMTPSLDPQNYKPTAWLDYSPAQTNPFFTKKPSQEEEELWQQQQSLYQ